MSTFASPLNYTLNLDHSTHAALDKACWIPAPYRQAMYYEAIPNTKFTALPSARSGTPPPELSAQECNETDHDQDPTSHVQTPRHSSSSPCTQPSWARNVVPVANWLVTYGHRLLNKKLDVRVKGTTNPPWHNGRFEDQLGFMVLTHGVYSLDSPIVVKIGFLESRAALQARHVVPEVTTERPRYPSKNPPPAVMDILSVPGIRVVIIGPDMNGSAAYVGNYALVQKCAYGLEPGVGLVQIGSMGEHWGEYIYVPIDSICRSGVDRGMSSIDWFGTSVE